jgi:radical SAM protein with 4Fe4S-binding SPASM domain
MSEEPGVIAPAPSLENLTISLSLACNQSCKHCWVSAGDAGLDDLTDEEIRSVLTQARALGAAHVKFTGGEPLLRPRLPELLEHAYAQGFRISVETNGVALGKAMVARLQPLFDRLHFYVSLDGATADTHDTFRGQRGAFLRAVRNLEGVRRAGGFFTVHTVARRENLTQIPEIFDLARRLGASQMKLILSVHDLGRGKDVQNDSISIDEVFELLQRLPPQRLWDYAWAPERSRETVLMTTLPPAFQPSGEAVTCGWSKSLLAVLANGEAAICHGVYELDEAKAGSVREQSLAEVWSHSQLLVEMRTWSSDSLSGICGNCAVAETCRGLCRASAIATYRDLRAPYPLCQAIYDAGRFPAEMLRDPARDSHYDARPRVVGPAVDGVRASGRRRLPLVPTDGAASGRQQ